MTPEQIALVQSTQVDRSLAEKFYERLFAAAPEVRPMFPADLVLQQEKFADELDMIVQSISNFPEFLHRVRALGARHVGYGTRTKHYAAVRTALLDTLADSLQWSDELEQAWAAAYDMVAEAMMLGGAAAPEHQTLSKLPLNNT